MEQIAVLIFLWILAVALAAFTMIVVRPKFIDIRETGLKERERIWEGMDRLACRRGCFKRLGPLVGQEQRAFSELKGAVSLEALERGSRDFQNSAFLLVALEVDAGHLAGELEIVVARHGRLFYHCFLRSTANTARQMIESARQVKNGFLAERISAAGSKMRN